MEHELEIILARENNVGFKVTANGITVIEADENGCIGDLWRHYQEAVLAFIKIKLTEIGKEMIKE